MRTACALELIHTYSLIHDDLPAMDDDSLRRGRPTLHVVAGEGMAILAGDGAADRGVSPAGLAAGRRAVTRVAHRGRGGRGGWRGRHGGRPGHRSGHGDASPSGQLAAPLDAGGVTGMHAMKTGALIRAAAVSGAIIGGGTDAQVAGIGAAAREFGLAFQIVDDILDVEGHAASLGKTPGKDAAAGKPTYPSFYGVAASRQHGRRLPAARRGHAGRSRVERLVAPRHRPLDRRTLELTRALMLMPLFSQCLLARIARGLTSSV